jgi:hypothetical protein
MEGDGGDGPELRSPDAFDGTDDGGVVVLATDQKLGILAYGHDVLAGQDELLLNLLDPVRSRRGLRRHFGFLFGTLLVALSHLLLLFVRKSKTNVIAPKKTGLGVHADESVRQQHGAFMTRKIKLQKFLT